jgi:DNA primase
MSIIDEIKQKVDIVDFVSEYVILKPSGRNFKAQCPFHTEKTPSFFVFPDQQSWHCFGSCGTGGDVFSFIMKKDGLDFGQALHILADKTGTALVTPIIHDRELDEKSERLYRLNEEAAAYFHHLLLNVKSGEAARKYLAERALSQQTIEHFQLGFSLESFDDLSQHLISQGYSKEYLLAAGLIIERDGGGYYDRFRNRIIFPIRDLQSRVIGFGARAMDDSIPKYLNSPQTIIFDKSSTLYAIDRAKASIRKKNMAIITEGYMDVITSHQNGWDNTVASMGTALTEKQLAVLKKLTKNITLALDADSAGENATLRIADIPEIIALNNYIDMENNLQNEVRVVVPSKGKDADEEIRQDPNFWADDLVKGKPLFDFIIDSIKNNTDMQSAQDKSRAADKFLPLVSKMSEPIRRGHYVQKFAQSLGIKETDLRDRLIQIRLNDKKRKPAKTSASSTTSRSGYFPDNIEEYCLSLLLQYPEMRGEGMAIPVEYFEYNENREIFLKWQQYSDIDNIINKMDPIIKPHFDNLLSQTFQPDLKGDDAKQQKVISDCTTRLEEKYLKNLAMKRSLLTSETQQSSKGVDAANLEENQQLKQVFIQRSRRQKPTLLKE